MKTTNHTPGPWKYNDTWGLVEYGKTQICALHSGNKANAHLIAASPDLLEALRFLLADYIAIQGDQLTGSSVPIEMARAAISKAEGLK